MTFDTDQTTTARVPDGSRQLSSEETALTQFRLVVDTYAQGITALNGKIGGKQAEKQALLDGIARLDKDIATLTGERDTKFNLMEGVNNLIREQEDRIRERERVEADTARREAALGR